MGRSEGTVVSTDKKIVIKVDDGMLGQLISTPIALPLRLPNAVDEIRRCVIIAYII